MAQTTQPFTVYERCTARYSATIMDEAEAAIPAASLDAVTLTLYDRDSGSIINSRDGQNVLNANQVTIDSNGALAWTMQPADNAIVGTGMVESELHVALFEYTYATTKAGKHEVMIRVKNLAQVP